MGGFGTAMAAITSIRNNRSLTSRKSAISFYRDRANKVRMSSRSDLSRKGSFKPKTYTRSELEKLYNSIRLKVRKEMMTSFIKAMIVTFIIGVVLYFLVFPLDMHLF